MIVSERGKRRNFFYIFTFTFFILIFLLIFYGGSDVWGDGWTVLRTVKSARSLRVGNRMNRHVTENYSTLIDTPSATDKENESLQKTTSEIKFDTRHNSHGDPMMVTIVIVACGTRYNLIPNALTLIKSAILFSAGVSLKVIIFRDAQTDLLLDESLAKSTRKLVKISENLGLKLLIEIHDSSFPKTDQVDWRNMYMPCTTQRLFLPTVLPYTDAVLYLDTDTIFVSPVKEIWKFFHLMNDTQAVAMVNEHEPPGDGWYNLKAKIPYYGPRGLNGGVALMNLTRLRRLGFEQEITEIQKQYKDQLPLADQDLLNIYFSKYPHLMYNLSCAFNYRQGHCHCDYPGGNCGCLDAEENGAAIVHGNIDGFNTFPLEYIQSLFSKYNLVTGNPTDLVSEIDKYWKVTISTFWEPVDKNHCRDSKILDNLLNRFKNYLEQNPQLQKQSDGAKQKNYQSDDEMVQKIDPHDEESVEDFLKFFLHSNL